MAFSGRYTAVLALVAMFVLGNTPVLAAPSKHCMTNKTNPSTSALSGIKLARASCDIGFENCGKACDVRWKVCTQNLGGLMSNDPRVVQCRTNYNNCVQGCRDRNSCG